MRNLKRSLATYLALALTIQTVSPVFATANLDNDATELTHSSVFAQNSIPLQQEVRVLAESDDSTLSIAEGVTIDTSNLP